MTDKKPKMGSKGQTIGDMDKTAQQIADDVIEDSKLNKIVNARIAEKPLNVDIPADLHHDLKLITTFNATTVKSVVAIELQKYVKREKKKMIESMMASL